ncbi:ABC transporter ATP-binding protein [Marinilabiliaceae bacterium JC017]|nr:ABC transporter ATP-binding protein [Marinilabiliaceae bacterium JC017]
MSQAILKLENIEAGYERQRVLHNVNLDVFANDFIGVIGPNGGGKTTLLKVMLGLLSPFSGKVTFLDPKTVIGYLPQVNSIDKQFPINVLDVILSGLGKRRKWWHPLPTSILKKAYALMELSGLSGMHNKAIGELSGGQMQRVFLCRAIINDPQLLILDEPNTFVDKNFEEDLYQILSELNERMAIVLVSHDIGTISSFVKTIACVNGNLHYHPANKITNEMLKSYNCPVEIISHGTIPHRVLKNHNNHD